MPVVSALSYDPTLKTVTVAGDIATVNLTSIVNYTKGRDIFIVGRTPVTNRVFSGGNTTFTLYTNTAGDSVSDVLAVRYQSSNILASISNGAIVNDVAHFVQSIKPLTRVDGTTLVVGDKWYKTTTGEDWFWNGTYWLSTQKYPISGSWTHVSTTASENFSVDNGGVGGGDILGGIFVRELRIKYRVEGTITLQNSSNHKRIAFTVRGARNQTRDLNYNASFLLDGINYPFATGSYQYITQSLNLYSATNDLFTIGAGIGVVGNPNFTLDSAFTFDIRGVHP